GRARTQFYTFDIHQNQEAKLRLISELHQGIARNEFMLYYQPIVDLNKGRIEGLEALLRWNHPMRGLLEPAEFLEAAEDSALIITIGDWVIEEACRLISQFRGKTFVSVNLSPRQLVQSNFARRFMKAVEKARIRADRVVVEVNEAAGCLENAQIHEVLNQLAQWQVGIGIDDFGTGSSSLHRLKETNIRFLKVANQWVAGVPHDPHCTAIARGAIGLSAGLGTLSLAEGVETKEQLRGLKQFGCSLAQGFFFSEPVPTQAVPALMKRSWKF
ncbi:MAG: EAL domain-containing protein, partial [Candidatus Eremiobacteraeota bacterium]|nr:EAL domain-containing protein [Candidatus Eremiobacteraeota bacterium]